MTTRDHINNLKEFIQYFSDEIKRAEITKDQTFDIERAETDIKTFKEAVWALERKDRKESTSYWVRFENGSYGWWYACAKCGGKVTKDEWKQDYFTPYCPHCGRKMAKPNK